MFKIGTRIKKVRGDLNIGATGVVCNGPTCTGYVLAECVDFVDIYVKFDCNYENTKGTKYQAGSINFSDSKDWEPIVPEGATPSALSFQELITSLGECDVEQLV